MFGNKMYEDIGEEKSIPGPLSCMLSCRLEVSWQRTLAKDYPEHRRMRTSRRVANSGFRLI